MEQYFTNNENLKSEVRTLTYNYKLYDFCFASDNGIFSKDKIDFGSRLLLETLLEEKNGISNFLDVGCGYGFLGIVISKVKNISGDMIDINKRALHLSKINAKSSKVNVNIFESSSYENVLNKYDLIITNPPIRAGNKVLEEILIGAKDYLTDSGELWFVMRKNHGAKSFEKLINNTYKLDIVKKSKGFYIFRAKNIDIH